jgi:hypothetical protein
LHCRRGRPTIERVQIASTLLLLAAACGGGQPAVVPDAPVSTDTWTSWANGFTTTYCAATCHAPGGTGVSGGEFDFTMYSKVYANRVAIRCGVAPAMLSDCSPFPAPKQFPCSGPLPSDADRTRLVAWIDAGAPQ